MVSKDNPEDLLACKTPEIASTGDQHSNAAQSSVTECQWLSLYLGTERESVTLVTTQLQLRQQELQQRQQVLQQRQQAIVAGTAASCVTCGCPP